MKYEFAAMGFDFDWLETNKKWSTVQNYTLVVLNRKKNNKKLKQKLFDLNEFIIQEKWAGYLD